VHACTDVTGFGLIGHASEMAKASGVTVTLEAGRLPVFQGVLAIAGQNRSGGLDSNQQYFGAGVAFEAEVEPSRVAIMYDPQTSGGLLVAASQDSADRVAAALAAALVAAVRIGSVGAARPGTQIVVRP
jgi:selenide,water dikinase